MKILQLDQGQIVRMRLVRVKTKQGKNVHSFGSRVARMCNDFGWPRV
jgi:hypothetical protein